MSNHPAQDLLFVAKVALEANRIDDSLTFVHHAIQQQSLHRVEFSIDDCLFIVNTFQTALFSKQKGFIKINSLAHSSISSPQIQNLVNRYLQTIVHEKLQLCHILLQLIDTHLIPLSPAVESKVVLCRSKSDILRICVDLSSNPQSRQGLLQQTIQTYQITHQIASILHPLHPLRLEVALQYSATIIDLFPSMKQEAILVARGAWQAAVDQLERQEKLSGHEESSRVILLQLYEAYTKWTCQSV